MATTRERKAWVRRSTKTAKPAGQSKPLHGELTEAEAKKWAKVMRSMKATRASLAARGVYITHEEIKRILNSD